MKKEEPIRLSVYSDADGQTRHLGEISYNSKRRESAFQWSEKAINEGLQWSSLKLKLSPNLWTSTDQEKDLMGFTTVNILVSFLNNFLSFISKKALN